MHARPEPQPPTPGGSTPPPGGADAPVWDAERLLTAGEAADLAGVPHRALREWIREGRLETRTGWREGLAVDLVRAGDLATLAPGLEARALPSVPVEDRSLVTGPRRSALGARTGPGETAPARPASDAPDDVRRWADAAQEELERLRAELAAARAGERERRAAGAAQVAPAAGEHAPTPAPEAATTRRRTRAASVAGLLGLALGVALGALLATAAPWAAHELPTRAVVRPPAPDTARRAPALPVPVATTPAVLADPTAVAPSGAPSPSTPISTPEPAVAAAPEAERAPAAPEPTPWERASFSGRSTAAEVDPLGFLPAAAGVPACAFHDLVRPGAAARADLGACQGTPTAEGDAVAGTHRVDGVPCCRHHQLVQRLGGDLEPLLAAARAARAEGVLPPLIAARIDRAAALFLRARFGGWRAAGIDGPGDAGHVTRWLEDAAPGTARVDTWVELEGGERRSLALTVVVSDGPEGDALLELAVEGGR